MSYHHHHHHSHGHHTIILLDKSKLGIFQIYVGSRKRRKTRQPLLKKSQGNKLSSFFNLVNEEANPHLNHMILV